jgi:hypothetical protein
VVYVYDPVECFMVIVLRMTRGIRSLTVWRLAFVKIIYKNYVNVCICLKTIGWLVLFREIITVCRWKIPNPWAYMNCVAASAEFSNVKRRWWCNNSFGLKGWSELLILYKTTIFVFEHFSKYIIFNKMYGKYNYGFMRYIDLCPHCLIVSVL